MLCDDWDSLGYDPNFKDGEIGDSGFDQVARLRRADAGWGSSHDDVARLQSIVLR